MESRRSLTQFLVLMTCCMVTILGKVACSSLQEDDDVPEPFFAHEMEAKRNTNQEDISKLLLKHLRFRQLPETDLLLTPADFRLSSNRHSAHKRKEQRMLVNNLAALLSGLRERQAESNMRMPSLRFGK